MVELKNFDNWEEIKNSPEGSGASEKLWLVNIKEKR